MFAAYYADQATISAILIDIMTLCLWQSVRSGKRVNLRCRLSWFFIVPAVASHHVRGKDINGMGVGIKSKHQQITSKSEQQCDMRDLVHLERLHAVI